jgi:hypothetical protein
MTIFRSIRFMPRPGRILFQVAQSQEKLFADINELKATLNGEDKWFLCREPKKETDDVGNGP